MKQRGKPSTGRTLEPIGREAWFTLASVSAVVFMVSTELTIISLALPEIRLAFPDTSESVLSWVVSSYSIGVAALLILGGWTADRYGRRRVFLSGLAIFAAGSLLATITTSVTMLIVARAVQAVGGALQFPSGLALLLTAFPRSRHQLAIGFWGSAGGLAAALAPTVGALLIEGFGWRAVFGVNVPVALLALLTGPRLLKESRGDPSSGSVDAVSVPLASLGVGAVVCGIVQGESWGWTSPLTILVFAAGAAGVGVFVIRSRRHPAPLFELDLFRLRSFTIGNIGTFFFCLGFFSTAILLPTYLQTVWDWSVLKTGLAFGAGPFLSFLISPTAGRLADRIGNAPILAACAGFGMLSLIWFRVMLTTQPRLDYFLVGSLLLGVAAGTGFAPLVGAAMRDVPAGKYAMAAAGRTTIFQLSIALAIAVAFAMIGRPETSAAALEVYQQVWLLSAAAFACLMGLFAFTYPRRPE